MRMSRAIDRAPLGERLASSVTADIEPGIYPAPDDPNDGLLICRLSSLHEVVAAISENWETA